MSRLGKKPIAIPQGTEVKMTGQNISVKGPAGVLTKTLHRNIGVTISSGELKVAPLKTTSDSHVMWGTAVSHIFNMIAGVNKPFEKRMLIEGVGFKADVKGTDVIFSVGYSHPVTLHIPTGIKVVSDKTGITISGPDIEQVGDFAARMRAVKRPEPYKGKGIRYADEVIRRKQGKKTA